MNLFPLILMGVVFAPMGIAQDRTPSMQELFEEQLSQSDVETLFRSRPYEVIYLVDGYLEAWLARQESGVPGDDPEVQRLMNLALKSALSADAVFERDTFTRYANAWKGWSADQRAQFRKGQAEYGAGRDAQRQKKYAEAREHYEKSLQLAGSLGDTWGEAQAQQALGDLTVGEGKFEEAAACHEAGRDHFMSIMHPSLLRSLNALGHIREQQGKLKAARENLEAMLLVAERSGRDVDATAVYESLARICRSQDDADAVLRYEALFEEEKKKVRAGAGVGGD